MDRRELNRIIDHVAAAIDAAPVGQDPFYHLKLGNIFPPDVYAKMMQEMPVASDPFSRMVSRIRDTWRALRPVSFISFLNRSISSMTGLAVAGNASSHGVNIPTFCTPCPAWS